MMAEPLDPLRTIWGGRWHCWHCHAPLGRIKHESNGLLLTPSRTLYVGVNNRGLLMVQCKGCCWWSQWWQGAPHVTPSLETANA